ncbi:Protein GAMETE EXPRESSED 2 [Platanthera guangdongensis]|uniref:Protein GAMETE EXPRESSED 2 n=1 Tax=Platanthera guangdongensis TaxID=2320717 RepID=A0ABR2MM57_9ASPA
MGVVDTSKSKVLNLESEVKQLGNNEVLVELVDSYWNHVPSQEKNLNLQLQGPNSSMLLKTAFVESKDGLYTGYYLSKIPGTYNICISFAEMILYPCPIMVHLHERNYFPEANNDSVSVWEDESVVFDILSNDYASDGQANNCPTVQKVNQIDKGKDIIGARIVVLCYEGGRYGHLSTASRSNNPPRANLIEREGDDVESLEELRKSFEKCPLNSAACYATCNKYKSEENKEGNLSGIYMFDVHDFRTRPSVRPCRPRWPLSSPKGTRRKGSSKSGSAASRPCDKEAGKKELMAKKL